MITFHEKEGIFALHGAKISYVMKVQYGKLINLHFGGRIATEGVGAFPAFGAGSFVSPVSGFANAMNMPNEYPTFGSGDFKRPALRVVDSLGNSCIDLVYKSYRILPHKPAPDGLPSLRGGETLVITLADDSYGVEAELFYTVYPYSNAIARRVEITNRSGAPLILTHAYSLCLDLPVERGTIVSLYGKHSSEAHVSKTPLSRGVFEVSSATGTTSHMQNPFMAITESDAENRGEAVGVNLVYSGNFSVSAERNPFGGTRLLAGINPFGFSWTLAAGEKFTAPEAVLAWSDDGLDGLSRAYHDVYRRYLLRPEFLDKPCPVVANSWEACFFDINEEKIFGMIDALENSGVDIFVLDDGWFGKRDADNSSLGDWVVDKRKFPNGLDSLIERCRKRGLRFGIWIEPECVSEDSDLYRAHPDWAITAPHGERSLIRNQLTLDLVRPEVLDYVKGAIYKLLSEHDISYVKWDMNRYLTQNYSPSLPKDRQGEFNHRYVLAFYELARFLTSSFPNVFFEGCAGGGGRVDPGMFAYFPQVWASDATDANERLCIGYGWSLCYPLCALSSHVTHSPNGQNGREIDAETRFNVAALGCFGLEFDVKRDGDRKEISRQVEKYRKIEKVLRYGNFYRLISPYETDRFAALAVSYDKKTAYLWEYQRLVSYDRTPVRIKLKGLLPDKKYEIPELGVSLYGDALMNRGIDVIQRYNDFTCKLYTVICEDEE